MHDREPGARSPSRSRELWGSEGKLVFWALVLAGLGFASIPSAVLLRAAEGYRRFVSRVDPAPLRAVAVRFTPRRGGENVDEQSRVDFVEFRLRAPKAKQVFLAGEFNGWKAGALPLSKQPDGLWDVLLPLARGRYRYVYLVDGQEKLDPQTRRSEEFEGRKVSVREIR